MTRKKAKAALLVASDRYSNQRIATASGVSVRTLDKWKKEPEFQRLVDEHLDAWQQRLFSTGIADKRRRLYRLNSDWRRLQAVREARAIATPKDVPGAATGLLMARVTTAGVEYRIDYAMLRERRAIEEQAAKELGQWKEIHEHQLRRLKDLSEEELEALVEDAEQAYGATAVRE